MATHEVGSGAPTHTTHASWEAATDITLTEREIARMYNQEFPAVAMGGAVANIDDYRWMQCHTDADFDHETIGGTINGTRFVTTGFNFVMATGVETFFRLGGQSLDGLERMFRLFFRILTAHSIRE